MKCLSAEGIHLNRMLIGSLIIAMTVLFPTYAMGEADNPEISAEPLWIYDVGGSISYGHMVAISSDGSYVAVVLPDSSIDNVYLLDESGTKLWSHKLDYPPFSAAISSDGSNVAVGTGTQHGHDAVLFDKQGSQLWSYDTGGQVGQVELSSDNRYIVSVGGGGVNLFDKEGRLLWRNSISGSRVAISAEGSYIAAGTGIGKGVYLFNEQGDELWHRDAKSGVQSLAITADGSCIAAGSLDDNVYLFEKDGSLLWSFQAEDSIWSVAISSDGSCVAAGSGDGNVYLFDKEGSKLWSHRVNGTPSVSISSDGSRIAAGAGNWAYLFDRDGRMLWSYEAGEIVSSMAISSDGKYVAAGSRDHKVYRFSGESRSDSSPDSAPAASPSEEHSQAPAPGYVKVYLNNQDDDELKIDYFFEDESKELGGAGSGSFSPGVSLIIETSDFYPGRYRFGITWKDPDTGDQQFENRTENDIPAGGMEVYLTAEEHLPPPETPVERPSPDEGASAFVSITNKDDDELEFGLYVDGNYSRSVKISPSNQYGDSLPVPKGTHKFVIKWQDPDTFKSYEAEETVVFEPGEQLAVKFHVDRRLPTTAKVYVNNKYHEPLNISLYIDNAFAGNRTLTGSDMELVDSWEHISSGETGFRIEWQDPKTGVLYKNETIKSLAPEETTSVTLIAEEHLEGAVYPSALEMYVGEKKNISLELKNEGGRTSRNVRALLGASEPFVTSLTSFGQEYIFGDITAYEIRTWRIPVEALKEGSCNLSFNIKGPDLGEGFAKSASIRVYERPQAAVLAVDESGNLKEEAIKQTSEQIETNRNAALISSADAEGFSKEYKGDGIEIKLSKGGRGSKYAFIGETIYVKFNIKNTGTYGMWVKIVPLEPDLMCEWTGDAVGHLPDRWRAPLIDEGVVSPYRDFNTLYYPVKTGEAGGRSIGGLAYVVAGEALEVTLKCIPKEEGRLTLGGTVYYTSSNAMNQLTLTDEDGSEFGIHYDFFENRYGHKDESFFAQDLKDFNKHFGIISMPPFEFTFERWVKLERLNSEELKDSVEVKEQKTFGQVVSDIFQSMMNTTRRAEEKA